jgi:hypothetical protein
LRGNGKGYGRCGEQTDLETDGRAVAFTAAFIDPLSQWITAAALPEML